jgi:murein DD-endopeptidase MepM/ murein hydrolase activator NlpD
MFMQEAEKWSQFSWLTRQRLVLFASTLIVIGVCWAIFDQEPEQAGSPYTRIIELGLPVQALETDSAITTLAEYNPAVTTDTWDSVTVRSGQTLDSIFRQLGFSIAMLHRILELGEDKKALTRIRPGDVFEFRSNDQGALQAMRYSPDVENFRLIRVEGDELIAETQPRQISSEIVEAEGAIKSSLFLAGKDAGLSDKMIMRLATIFGWDIDFVLDIREGDRFMLVYEKIYRDGEFLRSGNILAATFINQGERFQAIWYEDGDIAAHFTADGRNMRKAFLRAPLNFSYISSGFNPRRMHPVLKRIRAHNGIDYYAPKGTPVYAAGAGTVITSAYSAANGHHVFIKHANSIVTKYLHFSKRLATKGQKVRQGETIGLVGSTGLATGNHLHYEFVLNGVHRNPRTVPLPKVEPLEGEYLTRFQRSAAPMLTQLSRLESASLYAQGE